MTSPKGYFVLNLSLYIGIFLYQIKIISQNESDSIFYGISHDPREGLWPTKIEELFKR